MPGLFSKRSIIIPGTGSMDTTQSGASTTGDRNTLVTGSDRADDKREIKDLQDEAIALAAAVSALEEREEASQKMEEESKSGDGGSATGRAGRQEGGHSGDDTDYGYLGTESSAGPATESNTSTKR